MSTSRATVIAERWYVVDIGRLWIGGGCEDFEARFFVLPGHASGRKRVRFICLI